MKKRKVLMLGPGEPDAINSGLGIAAKELSSRLSELCNLTVIQSNDLIKISDIENNTSLSSKKIKYNQFSDFNVVSEISQVNVESSISPYWSDQNSYRIKEDIRQKHPIKEQLLSLTKNIITATQKMDYEVIYAHDWINFRAAIDLKKQFKKPLVLHVHSLDYDRNCGNQGSWVHDLEKEAFELADTVICVSNYSKKIIESIYGIAPQKISVVHNGYSKLDNLKYSSPFKEKIVLFVGRLTGQKGPTKFLEIAEKVHALYPNSRFIMAGEGDLYKSLIEAGAHSSIASKFHITGFLQKPDLLKTYAMADVYCMPSISEPFGLTALEAASAELPLVLSKNSGASEVLTAAMTSEYSDTQNFAKQIVTLLKNNELAQLQVVQNKKDLSLLDWSKSSQQVVDIINAV